MEKPFTISFVLPMFNESENINHTLADLKSLAKELTDDYEIVVVDDASTDPSADIVEALAQEDSTIKLFRLIQNSKFGGAFAEGFKKATKDVIVYMDSDMPVKSEDIKKSFPLIAEYDVVTGYSKVKKGDNVKRKIISGTYNLIVQVLFGLSIKDINSGYKVVRRSVVEDVDFISRSPFVDVEIFLHAKRKNSSVKQFPLVFRSRKGGQSYIARIPVIWATFVDMIKVRMLLCRRKD